LKSWPELVSVVVFGGLFDDGSGLQPSGCKLVGTDMTSACTVPHGNSIAICPNCLNEQPVCMCHPDPVTCGSTTFEGVNCCTADPASRYFEVATAMRKHEVFSICSATFFEPLQTIPSLPL
jgi:hypothetical protein